MAGEEGGIRPGGTGKVFDDRRYVDERGEPMPAGSPNPAEFKRMPVLMRLFMDQREIAKLLVGLANSPLPVDIRQLRINTKMQGFNNPLPKRFGVVQDTGRRTSSVINRGDRSSEEAAQNPYDVAVEMHGIIYIFNPPDPKLVEEVLVAEGENAAEPLQPTEQATTPTPQIPGESGTTTENSGATAEQGAQPADAPNEAPTTQDSTEAATENHPVEPAKRDSETEFEQGQEKTSGSS
jgi:hypothetical protein